MEYDTYQRHFWNNLKKRREPDHPLIETMVKNKLAALKKILPEFEQAKILEIGAGNGYYSYYLEQRCQKFWATDFSENMMRRNPCSRKIVANAYALPFQQNSFDIVFAACLLHHLGDMNLALAEMTRVTQKYVIILEPNALNPLMWLFGLLIKSERNVMKFTRNFLCNKVKEHQLSLIKAFTSGIILPNKMPSYLVRWLKTLDRQKFPLGMTNVIICQKE